ncbi:hypothetical protein CPB86DRAFT_772623 [Serendipita vermifera]|nr:hypothetical protein CPB86DRAFT_772623 [Serendipita vermifera]
MPSKQDLVFHLRRGSAKDTSVTADCHSHQFKLHTPPSTDLWRKPPVEAFNNPSLTASIQTDKLKSARVTVSARWTRLYDQAGLVLLWPGLSDEEPPVAWIKTGVEFYDNKANLSTVATPATSTSDWSLIPLSSNTVTIEIEREHKEGGYGPSLWIYLVADEGRKAVREITWAFSSERLLEKLHIGVYAARPTAEGGDDDEEELSVQFTDFEVTTI